MEVRRYPPIEELAVVGDRRSAAIIDAAGTIGWLCLPWYNSPPTLAALLDAGRGGSWSIRLRGQESCERSYAPREPVHRLRLTAASGTIEVVDFVAWPQRDRPDELEDVRLVMRLLRCVAGTVEVEMKLGVLEPAELVDGAAGARIRRSGEHVGDLRTSLTVERCGSVVRATGTMREGDVAWAALVAGDEDGAVSLDAATASSLLDATLEYWRDWNDGLAPYGEAPDVRDSATVLHLLTCAPAGATVAAPTTSLPERIGGDRNWDYRYSWIRDASISLAMLSRLDRLPQARSYMDWLAGLDSATDAPLQVVYQFDGGTDLPEHRRVDLEGYEGSLPVRTGNRAHGQLQLDSMGWFADCALTYLESGGDWADGYWNLLARAAEFTAERWTERDSGVWELPSDQHWTSSKVLSWVVLDRAAAVAEQLGHEVPTNWREAAEEVHGEVLDRAWDDVRQSFRQHYDGDGVDGSLLLIPLMGFLPADDPRVTGTVRRIRRELERDGFVYRFDPETTPGSESDLPLGEYEGAFLPCTCWLASALAMAGRVDEAARLLDRIASIAPIGLFAEQYDPRERRMLGNTPLLFTHAELIRARRLVAERRAQAGVT